MLPDHQIRGCIETFHTTVSRAPVIKCSGNDHLAQQQYSCNHPHMLLGWQWLSKQQSHDNDPCPAIKHTPWSIRQAQSYQMSTKLLSHTLHMSPSTLAC